MFCFFLTSCDWLTCVDKFQDKFHSLSNSYLFVSIWTPTFQKRYQNPINGGNVRIVCIANVNCRKNSIVITVQVRQRDIPDSLHTHVRFQVKLNNRPIQVLFSNIALLAA